MLTSRELGTIPGTTHRVRKDLVVQTAALRAAFERRFGKPLNLTDSYRPYSVQERIFRQRFRTYPTGHTDRRTWNGQTWWRVPGTASAATPGTSNHGWGTAIDWASRVNVGGSAEQRWMAANASRFGWTWPTWARNPASTFYEPWHYEATPVPVSAYRPFLVEHGITVPDVPALVPLEDAMTPEQAKQLDQIDRRTQQRLDANVSHVLARVTALDAALVNVTKALANVTNGEAFDEAKLLTGIRTTINDALAQGVDVTVQVGGKG